MNLLAGGDKNWVSYVLEKEKAVVLLSTMHDDSVKKTSVVIQYYNQIKSGMDTMDQMVRTYK